MKKLNQFGLFDAPMIIALIIILGVGSIIVLRINNGDEIEPLEQTVTEKFDEDNDEDVPNLLRYGELEDVTEGEDVRGINTGGESFGDASIYFNIDKNILDVGMYGLPDPKNDDFYEGWLVNPESGDFFSTGEAIKSQDKYINDWGYEEELTADQVSTYTKYILTLEPNDGDPAPADHILEGELTSSSTE